MALLTHPMKAPTEEEAIQAHRQQMAGSWPYFLADALTRISLGMVVIVVPPFLVLANLTHLYGWILLLLAVVGLLRAFKSLHLEGFLPALIASAFTLVFGLVLLVYPLGPLLDLRAVLLLYLLIEGISDLTFAYQFQSFRHAAGAYFTGSLALVMALVLAFGWPETRHFWQSSTLLGTLYSLQGFLLLALALGMKRFVDVPPAPSSEPEEAKADAEESVLAQSHQEAENQRQ